MSEDAAEVQLVVLLQRLEQVADVEVAHFHLAASRSARRPRPGSSDPRSAGAVERPTKKAPATITTTPTRASSHIGTWTLRRPAGAARRRGGAGGSAAGRSGRGHLGDGGRRRRFGGADRRRPRPRLPGRQAPGRDRSSGRRCSGCRSRVLLERVWPAVERPGAHERRHRRRGVPTVSWWPGRPGNSANWAISPGWRRSTRIQSRSGSTVHMSVGSRSTTNQESVASSPSSWCGAPPRVPGEAGGTGRREGTHRRAAASRSTVPRPGHSAVTPSVGASSPTAPIRARPITPSGCTGPPTNTTGGSLAHSAPRRDSASPRAISLGRFSTTPIAPSGLWSSISTTVCTKFGSSSVGVATKQPAAQ